MPGGTHDVGSLVVLPRRVDASTAAAARESLHRALDAGQGLLVVDLSGVHTIDATGLGMLIGAQRRATRAGRSIVLRGVPARVTRLLRATRLDRVLRAESGQSAGVGV